MKSASQQLNHLEYLKVITGLYEGLDLFHKNKIKQAFPSNQDAKIIREKTLEEIKKANPLAIISFPLVILIFIANALRFFWADTLYGIFIGIILPGFIFKNLF